MRCAIYGAGSLGTVLGAYMTKNGVPVELVNRNKAHVAALREKGATIKGTVEMNVPVNAITPDEMSGKYDVIFLMTKQLFNAEVVTFLKPFMTDNGVIVTLQNGIPEPGIAEIVGKNHTMGVTVEWGATLSAPGECILTSDPDSLSYHMGKMEGITDEQFETVKGLLEKMCPVHFEENLLGARWSKLLINATFSGLGTVVGGVFGANELLGKPFSKDELLNIAAEIEGHPDNVSPALLGGFTANAMEENSVRYVKSDVSEDLVFAAFVPPFELKTADARAVMPKEVSLKDSVFNLSRSALITASFLSGKYENLKLGCEDKLHQPFRLPLIPGGEKIIEKSYENGAIAAYISGAGSTMMAIFDCGNKKAEKIAKEILSSADFNGWKYYP